MLKVSGLRARYGTIEARGGVDRDLNKGAIVTINGASGARKTTMQMTI
jgi:ABC-type branched-subunit amino acid transport system ATPase component